jgi:predicted methyltransferase
VICADSTDNDSFNHHFVGSQDMTKSKNRVRSLVVAACAVLAAAASYADSSKSLDTILENQEESIKARYQYRHPGETLEFFGIKPGMTVVEVLPGGGWYTKLLLPYVGSEGRIIGVNYAGDMWPLFGFFNEEQLESFKTWIPEWVTGVEEARGDGDATASAFEFGSMPESMAGTADAVVMIRATHNLARFEDQGGYLTKALMDVNRILKPGGIVGLVQHEAAEDNSAVVTDGSAGYLQESYVVAQMEKNGFELMGKSHINHNHDDQPGADDMVWRLPPSLATSEEDPELREKYQAIGESNRMTLKFRKVR